MKTAIITDSTAYLEGDLCNHPDIYILELTTTFQDGTQFPDSADPKIQAEFYDKLKSSAELPTTSQPSPGKYMELIEKLITDGYERLLCIHLSQTFSGTYQTAKMITSQYADQIQAYVIDSKGVSVVMEALIVKALELLENDVEFEEICEKLDWAAKNSTIYLTVDDLEYLVKGGRLNLGAAKIGNFLKIKPLLYVDENGKVDVLDKIRTDKKVNRCLAKLAREDADKFPDGILLGFANAVDEDRMQDTIEAVTEKVPELTYKTATLGPVIGTHTGAGTVGMATIPKITVKKPVHTAV